MTEAGSQRSLDHVVGAPFWPHGTACRQYHWDSSFVKVGGLAFYGADRMDMFRRSAAYVDRILRAKGPEHRA
jgi:hypothetical protein